jgi:hypothetical protein
MSYAQNRIYDLHNVADHVSQLAQNAQVYAEHGDLKEALSHLEHAERSASLIEMHLRGAIAAVRDALLPSADDTQEARS